MNLFTHADVGIICVGYNMCTRFCVRFPLSVYTQHVSRCLSFLYNPKLYASHHLTIWARIEYCNRSILHMMPSFLKKKRLFHKHPSQNNSERFTTPRECPPIYIKIGRHVVCWILAQSQPRITCMWKWIWVKKRHSKRRKKNMIKSTYWRSGTRRNRNWMITSGIFITPSRLSQRQMEHDILHSDHRHHYHPFTVSRY